MMKFNMLERGNIMKSKKKKFSQLGSFGGSFLTIEAHCGRQRVPASGRFGGPTFAGPPSEYARFMDFQRCLLYACPKTVSTTILRNFFAGSSRSLVSKSLAK